MVCRPHLKTLILPCVSLITAVALIMGCSSQQAVTDRPAITLKGLTLSQEIIQRGDTAVPKGISSTYWTTDQSVAALISFQNLYGIIDLRWDWFGPDRVLYLTKRAKTMRLDKGKYYKEFNAWHVLKIAGDKAAGMPGDWSVNVFMNDSFLLSKSFTIMEAGLE